MTQITRIYNNENIIRNKSETEYEHSVYHTYIIISYYEKGMAKTNLQYFLDRTTDFG